MSAVLKRAAHFFLLHSLGYFTYYDHFTQCYAVTVTCWNTCLCALMRQSASLQTKLGIRLLTRAVRLFFPSCVEEGSSAAPRRFCLIGKRCLSCRLPGACSPASGSSSLRLILARDFSRLVWRHPTKSLRLSRAELSWTEPAQNHSAGWETERDALEGS